MKDHAYTIITLLSLGLLTYLLSIKSPLLLLGAAGLAYYLILQGFRGAW